MVEISIATNLMFSEFSTFYSRNVENGGNDWKPMRKTLKNSLTYWKTKGREWKNATFCTLSGKVQSKFRVSTGKIGWNMENPRS